MKQHNEPFKIMRTLHLSLLSAQSLFALIAFIMVQKGIIAPVDESLSRILQVMVVLLSLGMLYFGFKVFKGSIMTVRNSQRRAEDRMANYQRACILWWAMIEVPGLVSTVCYLLTSNLSFLFLAIFHVLILLLFTPRKENVYLLLNLSSQEISRLEEGNS